MDRLTLENQFKVEASSRVIDTMTEVQVKQNLKNVYKLAVELQQDVEIIQKGVKAQQEKIVQMHSDARVHRVFGKISKGKKNEHIED